MKRIEQSDPELKQAIAERVRYARKMAGLSQRQVAKMLGVQQSPYCNRENGSMEFSALEMVKLAEIFQVDLLWLMAQKPLRLEAMPDTAHGYSMTNHQVLFADDDQKKLLLVLAAIQQV